MQSIATGSIDANCCAIMQSIKIICANVLHENKENVKVVVAKECNMVCYKCKVMQYFANIGKFRAHSQCFAISVAYRKRELAKSAILLTK